MGGHERLRADGIKGVEGHFPDHRHDGGGHEDDGQIRGRPGPELTARHAPRHNPGDHLAAQRNRLAVIKRGNARMPPAFGEDDAHQHLHLRSEYLLIEPGDDKAQQIR